MSQARTCTTPDTKNHLKPPLRSGQNNCVETFPLNAVPARKTPEKGIKENTLQCYIDYSKIILMEKGAGLNS